MKRIANNVTVRLTFNEGLSMSEVADLEAFIEGGFDQNKQWGTPGVKFELTPIGVKEVMTDKGVMTSKKVLELEKEHAGKK